MFDPQKISTKDAIIWASFSIFLFSFLCFDNWTFFSFFHGLWTGQITLFLHFWKHQIDDHIFDLILCQIPQILCNSCCTSVLELLIAEYLLMFDRQVWSKWILGNVQIIHPTTSKTVSCLSLKLKGECFAELCCRLVCSMILPLLFRRLSELQLIFYYTDFLFLLAWHVYSDA